MKTRVGSALAVLVVGACGADNGERALEAPGRPGVAPRLVGTVLEPVARDAPRAPLLVASVVPRSAEPDTELEKRIRRWVDDLRHDHVRWNAREAMRELARISAPAFPELRGVLTSPDLQQRRLALDLACGMALGGKVEVDRPLLLAAVDRLSREADSRVDFRDRYHPYVGSIERSVRLLERHGRSVWPELRLGLGAADPQRRFLSAYLLAWTRCPDDVPTTCRRLVEHLADNDVAHDAVFSMRALFRLGEPALPTLRAERRWADAQARKLIDHLERRILGRPVVLPDEGPLFGDVTTVVVDPVTDSGWRNVPWIR